MAVRGDWFTWPICDIDVGGILVYKKCWYAWPAGAQGIQFCMTCWCTWDAGVRGSGGVGGALQVYIRLEEGCRRVWWTGVSGDSERPHLYTSNRSLSPNLKI